MDIITPDRSEGMETLAAKRGDGNERVT